MKSSLSPQLCAWLRTLFVCLALGLPLLASAGCGPSSGKGTSDSGHKKKKDKKSKKDKKDKKSKKDKKKKDKKTKKDKKSKTDPSGLGKKGNKKVKTFTAAKRKIKEVFKGKEKTFYCGCSYEDKDIDFKSCGYKVRKNKSRASRMEVEHVVPAARFGENLSAWRDGDPTCVNSKGKTYKGRRCAGKVSEIFRLMEADLYNLQPAIGEVNGDRSDKGVGNISGEKRDYGKCDVEINKDLVEPKKSIRGDVARTYFYMDWAYPGLGIVNAENRALLESWDKSDPLTKWERERGKRIKRIQGNENPFLK